MRKSFFVAALLSLSVSAGAMAEQQQHGGTAEEQKACAHDVQKHCRSVMNEADLIVLSCLQQNRAKLTKACDKVLVRPRPVKASKAAFESLPPPVPGSGGRLSGTLRMALVLVSIFAYMGLTSFQSMPGISDAGKPKT